MQDWYRETQEENDNCPLAPAVSCAGDVMGTQEKPGEFPLTQELKLGGDRGAWERGQGDSRLLENGSTNSLRSRM